MKPRHLALGAALVIAAGFAIFGDKTPSSVAEAVDRGARPAAPAAARAPAGNASTPAPARAAAPTLANAPVPASAAPAPVRASGAKPVVEPQILRLLPRDELLGEAGDGKGAVFGSQNWNVAPPAPPPPPPPPPPTAPPLPFVFLGKAVADGDWEIYLGRGDKTYSVRKQTVIDGVYRVDAIAPPMMTLTYLPLNQVQQINIGVFD